MRTRFKYIILCILTCVISVTFSSQDLPKRILFFGDSLTEGLGVDQSKRYTALLRDSIQKYKLNYTIVNAGVSGETTSGGLRRINWVLQKPVDVFVLGLGSNDGLRGIDTKLMEENLKKILTIVKTKNPSAELVLLGAKAAPNMGTVYSEKFDAVFKSVAKEYNTSFVPFLLEGVGGVPSLNNSDGIHPNPKGHAILAKNVWGKLREVLK